MEEIGETYFYIDVYSFAYVECTFFATTHLEESVGKGICNGFESFGGQSGPCFHFFRLFSSRFSFKNLNDAGV